MFPERNTWKSARVHKAWWSPFLFVCVTDGAADSGELDLNGIDDSEIELVGLFRLLDNPIFEALTDKELFENGWTAKVLGVR